MQIRMEGNKRRETGGYKQRKDGRNKKDGTKLT
jgi:hypothetical protein